MKAVVEWKGEMAFTGLAGSGVPIDMDSDPSLGGTGRGVRPMELIAMGLAGCMAMDVLSILLKKKQNLTSYQVNIDAPRFPDYPKVFTSAVITFVLAGRNLEESALLRSIELAATKYCPAHAMLAKAFPITMAYEIHQDDDNGSQLKHQGTCQVFSQSE